MPEPKPVRAWAMFYPPSEHIFTESCRRLRSQVVAYADNDCATTWNWSRYRKAGFRIIRVEIHPLSEKERAER